MCASITGFVVGIFWLQQQALLPDKTLLFLYGLAVLLSMGLSFWTKTKFPLHAHPTLRAALHIVAGVFFGIVWASLLAQHYLDERLSEKWENR
ncbi:MAG: hypothetical protein FWG19_01115, partial [Methanomassiliicoccaceae archaeon]|nr:hypothetical protein [Methanomassiliicoccaceae archaeon]